MLNSYLPPIADLMPIEPPSIRKIDGSGSEGETNSPADIKKVAQDFEAIFLRLVLREMRKTVPKDEEQGDSLAQDIYFEMMDSKLADSLSSMNVLGIAPMVESQLTRINDLVEGLDPEGQGFELNQGLGKPLESPSIEGLPLTQKEVKL